MGTERDQRDGAIRHDEDRLHDMGGNIGPASIRGSGRSPETRPGTGEPQGGYSEPAGYMAGRDDDWTVTAGSDEKAVGARTDEIAGDRDTAGPAPQAGPQTAPGDPGFRVSGPIDESLHGVIDEPADADEPGAGRQPGALRIQPPAVSTGHVSADEEWASSDEDDPDLGSGRTDADDGGYLPGEGTGRPYYRG